MAVHTNREQQLFTVGVSLGEAALLLAFVLLVALGALRKEHDRALADIAGLKGELSLARAQLAANTLGVPDPDATAPLDRLVEWMAVTDVLEAAGLVPADFEPELGAAIRAALDLDYTAEELIRSMTEMRRLERAGVPLATPEDWDRLREAVALADAAGPEVPPMLVDPRMVDALRRLGDLGYGTDQLVELVEALPALAPPGARGDVPENLDRLREGAARDAALAAAGLDVPRVLADPAVFVSVQTLLRQGYSASQLLQGLAMIPRLGATGGPLPVPPGSGPLTIVPGDAVFVARLRELIELGLSPADVDQALNLARTGTRGNNPWPPIIRLTDTNGQYFATGSAELRPAFLDALKGEIDNILAYIDAYDVDVIEVIGHTDEQPVFAQSSNLDRGLIPVLAGRMEAVALIPADNAGLGMARAVAAARVLMNDPRLAGFTIIPMSAAQVIDDGTGRIADGTRDWDIPERRRIEIRLRQSD
ncbi:MAG: hypothetical protein ACWA6X_04430 [Bauldia sp.]